MAIMCAPKNKLLFLERVLPLLYGHCTHVLVEHDSKALLAGIHLGVGNPEKLTVGALSPHSDAFSLNVEGKRLYRWTQVLPVH